MACLGERQPSRYNDYKSSQSHTHVVEPTYSASLCSSDSPIDTPLPTHTLDRPSDSESNPHRPQGPEQHSPQRPSNSSRPKVLNRGSSYGTPYRPRGMVSAAAAAAAEEEEEEFAQTLSWIPRTPYTGQQPRQRLEKPVAIPQIDGGRMSRYMPFTRAYSPVLQAHDIHVEEFIAFVDNLAVVQAPLPPFQTVGIVGLGISFVPHHWSKLVDDVGMAPNADSTATSRLRTDKYLKEANQRYFAPRGLKVRLVRDSELGQLVGFPDEFSSLRKVHPRPGSQAHRRRQFCVLDGYISTLNYDIPAPTHPKNILDRINAKRVDAQLVRPYKNAHKDHHKHLNNVEHERDGRASAASICLVSSSSSSESVSDSDSAAASKSELGKKSKSPELEGRSTGLDSKSETSAAELRDLKQVDTIEERRPKPTELAVNQHHPEQLQSTFSSHKIAQRHKAHAAEKPASSQRTAEKQVKNLMWIFIDNIQSDKVPPQE